MNCSDIISDLGYSCQCVDGEVMYIASPFSLGYDSERIGAYVCEKNGMAYITDDGDQLFTAQTHGLRLNVSKINKMKSLLEGYNVNITDSGEVAAWCEKEKISMFLPIYLEASIRLSSEIDSMFAAAQKNFHDVVSDILDEYMPRRVSKDVEYLGTSGHQISFPFVIDFNKPSQKIIQTISSNNGKSARWDQVLKTVGKLVEVKSDENPNGALVVIEPCDNEEVVMQARMALVDYAGVIELRDHSSLIKRLVA